MASIANTDQEFLSTWYAGHDRPQLDSHFSLAERRAMYESDLLAGRTVPLLLSAVIFAGVILAIVSLMCV